MKLNIAKAKPLIDAALESCVDINKMDRTQIQDFITNAQSVLSEFSSVLTIEVQLKLHLGIGDAGTKIGMFDQSEQQYQTALLLCKEVNETSFKVKAVNGICILSAIRCNYLKAIEGWNNLLHEIQDLKTRADIYNNLGIAYSMTDKHQDALDCQYQCLKIDDELNRETEMATDYFNLASSYMKLKQFDKSLELYNLAALSFEKSENFRYLSFAYSNLSMLHCDLGDFDRAIDFANRSLELKQKFSSELEIANTYANIGSIFNTQKHYDQALEYYDKAKAIFESGADMIALSGLYIKFAWLHYNNEEKDLATEYGLKSFNLAKEINSSHTVQEAAKFLSKVYAEQEQFKQAFHYLQIYSDTYKKIFEDNPKIMIARSEADFYRKKTEEQADIYRQKNIELTEMNQVISDQSRLLYIANKDLENTNVLMRKLFSIIGHDIRGPVLTAVQALNLVKTSVISPEESESLLTDIALSLSNTGNLLGDLLSWSNVKQQSAEPNLTVLNVVPIISDCLTMYKSSAQLKFLTLSYQGHEEVFALVNKNAVHTIVRNLIRNAIKFTPEHGTITVKTRSSKTKVMIDVIDTGIGISAANIKLLLSGNAQSRNGTNTESGTGFGIGLCLTYIRQIHGKLTIKSTLKQGSTFTITIPKA